MTISLCMIVKNEEDVLERCLASIKDLVDEIIIVDTGSSDKTCQIASKFTDLVYYFDWIEDFSAARNYAFSKASMEYCMWLDADDVITAADQCAFLTLKKSLTAQVDVVMMRYNTAFDELGNCSFWYYRERLVKNDGTFRWEGFVHEVITPHGNVVHWDAAVTHKKNHCGDSDRNLNIYRHMIASGAVLNAREQYYYGRELYYHALYQDAADTFSGFLDNSDGWIENKLEACVLLSHCLQNLGLLDKALEALFRTLSYDVPRAEVCCEIGAWFLDGQQYQQAIFWYHTALDCRPNPANGGFISADCYDYIPALQLCVLYDRVGNYAEAVRFNEMAGAAKPNSSSYIYNKKYFAGIKHYFLKGI